MLYFVLNMFRMLVHSSSGAWDCVWVYCSGSMCVGVTVWFGWGGVVSLCRLRHCLSLDTTSPQPNHTVTPTHIEPEQYTHTQSQAPEDECTSIRNMLSKNKASDISWSIFIQLGYWIYTDFTQNKLSCPLPFDHLAELIWVPESV